VNTTDSFGYWVRRRRKALDLTQAELAQRVGCAAVTLRKIETDSRHPSRPMAERLANCLELTEPEWGRFVATAVGECTATHLSLLPTNRRLGNLPASVTSLVGRAAEITAIIHCLHRKEVRLLTLTGPVGVGKTRLALAAGEQLRSDYRHGVCLVALAAVTEPYLVPAAVAAVLGVRESHTENLAQTVIQFLASREMLLIFDNFEHLLRAASFLSAMLAECPHLQLLVTSQTRLHLYGEHEMDIAPLPLPELDDLWAAADSAAVRLFCERAQAVQATFQLTPSLIPAVAEICRRLDGLPLAIELAAAHIRLFSPQELRERLERRLPLLEAGATDLPPRQQRLENAIAWSLGLLTAMQRRMLARLAVFSGGFSLAAAETVCAFPSPEMDSDNREPGGLPDTAVTIAALLDHSLLVRHTAGVTGSAAKCCPDCPTRQLREQIAAEPRLTMLAVIREFALENLETDGELTVVQQRHAAYFVHWAAEAVAQLHGPDQGIWLARLEREADNVRAALHWLLATEQVEMAAHLACDWGEVWQRHGRYSEGRGWLEKVLAHMAGRPTPGVLRAHTLQTAAMLAYRQGKWPTALQELDESLALCRSAGDQAGMARVFFDLGWITLDQGKWAEAMQHNRQSLALAQTAGDRVIVYRALTNLGWAQLCLGCPEEAAALLKEAYELAQQLGHTRGVAVSLVNLGWIALYAGERAEAVRLVREGLRLCHLLGEREVLAEGLEVLAATAVAAGNPRQAAQLGGAAEAIWRALQVTRSPVTHNVVSFTRTMAAAGEQLTAAEFAAAWGRGQRMNLDTAASFALHCQQVKPA
jgi:predicted ATPase/transcriptional regulator with XRE-family HTH domain